MSYLDLLGGWDDLAASLDARDTASRWSNREPVLAEATRIDDLRRLTAPGDPARADQVLGGLVRLAAADGGDDPDALLVLLHLLRPGASRIVTRFRHLCPDADGLVVGELAAQIRRFPWHRRTRAHAANLLRDTQAALWREMRPYRSTQTAAAPEILIQPDAISLTSSHAAAAADATITDELDLVDVLRWAERTGIADAANLRLLVELEYTRELVPGSCRENVAAAHGISTVTVDRRRNRTLRALRAAATGYLAA